jgi:hypothetical protein
MDIYKIYVKIFSEAKIIHPSGLYQSGFEIDWLIRSAFSARGRFALLKVLLQLVANTSACSEEAVPQPLIKRQSFILRRKLLNTRAAEKKGSRSSGRSSRQPLFWCVRWLLAHKYSVCGAVRRRVTLQI